METKPERVERASKEAQENNAMLSEMFCPFGAAPCFREKCWSFRPQIGAFPDSEMVKGDDGRFSEVRNGFVFAGKIARCEQKVYPAMIIESSFAEGFSVDADGNVIDPSGKAVKDNLEEFAESYGKNIL
jgi:hypothetical protein